MITVHHLNLSRSHRIIWLLEELGIPYKIESYERDQTTMLAPPSMRNTHSLGISPFITDGDITLAESGAIIEYILQKYGNDQLRPEIGSNDWVQYLFWLHFAEGSLMPLSSINLLFTVLVQKSPFFIRPIARAFQQQIQTAFVGPRLTRFLDYTEATLNQQDWLAGNHFTAADIQVGITFILSKMHQLGQEQVARPKLDDYLQRLQKRPAYERTLKVAGTLDFAEYFKLKS